MRRTVLMRAIQGLALLALIPAFVFAAGDDRQSPRANYKLASKYSLKQVAARSYSTGVIPNWIGKTDEFWYSYRTSQGTLYWRVDPAAKTRKTLFDREKVASQLAELSRRPVDAETMQIGGGQVSEDGGKFLFNFAEMRYEYDIKNDKLASKGKATFAPPTPGMGKGFGGGRRRSDAEFDDAFEQVEEEFAQQKTEKKEEKKNDKIDKTKEGSTVGKGPTTRIPSPDKKSYIFTKSNDLYMAETGKEKEAVQLSKGGTEEYGFALFGGFGGGGFTGGRFGGPRGVAPLSTSTWSKESKFFHVSKRDRRNVKELFVINSLATPRPTLAKYPYPMPGEDYIQKSELHIGSRDGKAVVRLTPKWKDEMYSTIHWGKEPGELRFVRMDRLRRNLELCALDCASNKCRAILSEGFENAPIEYQSPVYLDASNEMIWWSEKSGWAHFYLHDRNGKLKNAITKGQWRASSIVALDEKNRTLYFRGNAREKDENVYYEHLYSVKLDGSNLTLLDPGNAHHISYLSPSGKYVVDNTSRIDKCPESLVRDAKGYQVLDLEKTDLSKLEEYGWKPAETFAVKAADGVTDLYGNMWKPFDFDAKKKYPIIAYVYPGPQQEGVTHTFSTYSSNMQLAQLGFIVIQVGHRGGSPLRSKAYGSYGYFNLRDYGLVDKKHAIEQLAAKYPWIDLKNVGIYGHSGGGFMTAAALLQKPYNEFFKAGVASAGNHDNNIYNNFWSEKYHGLKEVPVKAEDKTKKGPPSEEAPVAPPTKQAKTTTTTKTTPAAPPTKFEIKVPTNAELASNLKGRLLLVHGEADSNVHPANTMRLVDALIKANKRFDMLILPNTNHGFGTYTPYFNRRMQEFFAEHLLGDRRTGADFDTDE